VIITPPLRHAIITPLAASHSWLSPIADYAIITPPRMLMLLLFIRHAMTLFSIRHYADASVITLFYTYRYAICHYAMHDATPCHAAFSAFTPAIIAADASLLLRCHY